MNTEALLTPGGIADQLGRSLSGVTQAYADYNRQKAADAQQQFQNNRMTARDALDQQRYAQLMAQQQHQNERQAALDAQAAKDRQFNMNRLSASDALAQQLQQYKMADMNPRGYLQTDDPALAQFAQAKLGQNQFEHAVKGYVDPRDIANNGPQQDWHTRYPEPVNQGFAAKSAADALAHEKIRAPRDYEAEYAARNATREEQDRRAFEGKTYQIKLENYYKDLADWKDKKRKARDGFSEPEPMPPVMPSWMGGEAVPTVAPVDREAIKRNVVADFKQFINP